MMMDDSVMRSDYFLAVSNVTALSDDKWQRICYAPCAAPTVWSRYWRVAVASITSMRGMYSAMNERYGIHVQPRIQRCTSRP